MVSLLLCVPAAPTGTNKKSSVYFSTVFKSIRLLLLAIKYKIQYLENRKKGLVVEDTKLSEANKQTNIKRKKKQINS